MIINSDEALKHVGIIEHLTCWYNNVVGKDICYLNYLWEIKILQQRVIERVLNCGCDTML